MLFKDMFAESTGDRVRVRVVEKWFPMVFAVDPVDWNPGAPPEKGAKLVAREEKLSPCRIGAESDVKRSDLAWGKIIVGGVKWLGKLA